MNGLQTLPQWREFFGSPEGALLGLMNSVYPLGKVISLFVVAYICDRWGRKLPILIGLVTCIGFATLQGLSQNLHSFIIARAFLGFFTSFIGQPSPIIITELAYPTQRGKVTALYNTFFVSLDSILLGQLCSILIVCLKFSTLALFSQLGVHMAPSRTRRLGAGEFRLCCKVHYPSFSFWASISYQNPPGKHVALF